MQIIISVAVLHDDLHRSHRISKHVDLGKDYTFPSSACVLDMLADEVPDGYALGQHCVLTMQGLVAEDDVGPNSLTVPYATPDWLLFEVMV